MLYYSIEAHRGGLNRPQHERLAGRPRAGADYY